MSKCDYAFSYQHEDEIANSRYMRLPSYVRNSYEFGKRGEEFVKVKIDLSSIKKQKTKFCNFIYANDVPFRNEFFKKLNEYKKVDAPGRCMNNIYPIGNKKSWKDSRLSEDWNKEKLNFLKKYKFTIAFQNGEYGGYVDEKICDPMKVESIPIFWGNSRIGDDFNTKSFINVHDFKNIDEVIERIKEIDQNDKLYEKMLKEPWLPNNRLTKWFDEEKILSKLVEIVETEKSDKNKHR